MFGIMPVFTISALTLGSGGLFVSFVVQAISVVGWLSVGGILVEAISVGEIWVEAISVVGVAVVWEAVEMVGVEGSCSLTWYGDQSRGFGDVWSQQTLWCRRMSLLVCELRSHSQRRWYLR